MKKMTGAITSALVLLYSNVVQAMIISQDPGISQVEADRIGKILGYIQWFAFVIAVGILILYGIKYVMSTANEKADLKSGLIKYVLGAFIIALAPTIAKWMFGLW